MIYSAATARVRSKDTPFPCTGTVNYIPVRVVVNTGRFPLTPGETGRLPGRTVTPLSLLENNGRLLYNYVANIFAYPYP